MRKQICNHTQCVVISIKFLLESDSPLTTCKAHNRRSVNLKSKKTTTTTLACGLLLVFLRKYLCQFENDYACHLQHGIQFLNSNAFDWNNHVLCAHLVWELYVQNPFSNNQQRFFFSLDRGQLCRYEFIYT